MVAYIDGGSRGNPGPAGYGVRIEDAQAALVEELHGALGVATNNVAEYHGLLAALAWAADRGVTALEIRSDSELLVKQMLGGYRVKHPGLQPLHQRARLLVARVGRGSDRRSPGSPVRKFARSQLRTIAGFAVPARRSRRCAA
jgi:ribonuclease HI